MIIDGIPVGLEHDITIYQGRTFEMVFLVREADESTPVPLTGYEGYAELRSRPRSPTVLMEFEVLVEAALGKVTMRASASATDELTRGGSYDLALVKTQGATPLVLAFAQGRVTLDKETTDVG